MRSCSAASRWFVELMEPRAISIWPSISAMRSSRSCSISLGWV
jgi:hypothetical protein